jgi:hypothetical protein
MIKYIFKDVKTEFAPYISDHDISGPSTAVRIYLVQSDEKIACQSWFLDPEILPRLPSWRNFLK